MEIQVSTLGGVLQNLTVDEEAPACQLQELICRQFSIQPFELKVAHGEHILKFQPGLCMKSLGISPHSMLVAAKMNRTWFWANAQGQNPCVDVLEFVNLGMDYCYYGLE